MLSPFLQIYFPCLSSGSILKKLGMIVWKSCYQIFGFGGGKINGGLIWGLLIALGFVALAALPFLEVPGKMGNFGAEDGTRTRYLQLGKLSLYQVSYFRLQELITQNDWSPAVNINDKSIFPIKKC
jgi:hypothetical protein